MKMETNEFLTDYQDNNLENSEPEISNTSHAYNGMNIPEILIVDAPDVFDSSAFLPIPPESLSGFGVMGAVVHEHIHQHQEDDEDVGSNSDDENTMPSKSLIANGSSAVLTNNASNAAINKLNNDSNASLKNGTVLSPKLREESPTMASSDLSESEVEVDGGSTEIQCGCESHFGRELVNRVFPFSVSTIFDFIFTDSTFYREMQLSRKTTDMILNDWRTHKDGKVREISYTVYVNLVGIKTAQTSETQILQKASKRGRMYIIDVEALTAGVPYSEHFVTQIRYCITRVSPEECRVRVFSQIKYKKNVWPFIKTFIEKNTWTALEEYFRDLESFLIKEATKSARVSLPSKLDKTIKDRQKRKSNIVKSNLQVRSDNTWTMAPPEIRDSSRSSLTSDVLVPFILLVLILLLILNALLYYKLWALEANSNQRNVFPDFIIDSKLLLQKPKSNEDWVKLIHRQETLHQAEIMKWREVIDTVVSLLQQTEDSLISLKHKIIPYSNSNTDETIKRGS